MTLNLLGMIAGMSLIFRFGGGMYIATIQFIAILAWVIFNAWSLLTEVGADQDHARA